MTSFREAYRRSMMRLNSYKSSPQASDRGSTEKKPSSPEQASNQKVRKFRIHPLAVISSQTRKPSIDIAEGKTLLGSPKRETRFNNTGSKFKIKPQNEEDPQGKYLCTHSSRLSSLQSEASLESALTPIALFPSKND
jgi:hypothetical protein